MSGVVSSYSSSIPSIHCNEDQIYVFPEIEMKLRGLIPHFHIHVSVSDLYVPRILPPILEIRNEAGQFHF
jgi:hypothetical protein